jgi:nucleoid-associated protein YgaU
MAASRIVGMGSPVTMIGRMARPMLVGAAAVALAATVLSGCGRKVLRSADVASADYYSSEEFRHLSDEQREEYCGELAYEFELQREREDWAEREKVEVGEQARAAAVRSRLLMAEILKVQADLAARRGAEGGARTGASDRYVVRPGDSLWEIAVEFLGDGRRWTEIRDANRDRLRDEDRIPVGLELTIPGNAEPAVPGRGGS